MNTVEIKFLKKLLGYKKKSWLQHDILYQQYGKEVKVKIYLKKEKLWQPWMNSNHKCKVGHPQSTGTTMVNKDLKEIDKNLSQNSINYISFLGTLCADRDNYCKMIKHNMFSRGRNQQWLLNFTVVQLLPMMRKKNIFIN